MKRLASLTLFLRRYWLVFLAGIFSVISVATLVGLLFRPEFNDGSSQIDTYLAERFGALVGGVVGPLATLAGFFLLFETLRAQRDIFRKQSFESRFFVMLSVHRKNVAEMVIRSRGERRIDLKSRRVFIAINKQFSKLYKFFRMNISTEAQLRERDFVNLAYLSLFFGPRRLRGSCSIYIKQYEPKIPNLKALLEQLEDMYTEDGELRLYVGHQTRLGHYYRHLYQSISYIDTRSYLSAHEKMEYVKMLRAQLSTPEIETFFFNSLSTLGQAWELGGSGKKMRLITKYQLIKNLPYKSVHGIRPKKYYKKIRFEYEENFES